MEGIMSCKYLKKIGNITYICSCDKITRFDNDSEHHNFCTYRYKNCDDYKRQNKKDKIKTWKELYSEASYAFNTWKRKLTNKRICSKTKRANRRRFQTLL